MVDPRQRKNIKIGLFVEIIQKPHQRTGELTKGMIDKILTKNPFNIHMELKYN